MKATAARIQQSSNSSGASVSSTSTVQASNRTTRADQTETMVRIFVWYGYGMERRRSMLDAPLAW